MHHSVAHGMGPERLASLDPPRCGVVVAGKTNLGGSSCRDVCTIRRARRMEFNA